MILIFLRVFRGFFSNKKRNTYLTFHYRSVKVNEQINRKYKRPNPVLKGFWHLMFLILSISYH